MNTLSPENREKILAMVSELLTDSIEFQMDIEADTRVIPPDEAAARGFPNPYTQVTREHTGRRTLTFRYTMPLAARVP